MLFGFTMAMQLLLLAGYIQCMFAEECSDDRVKWMSVATVVSLAMGRVVDMLISKHGKAKRKNRVFDAGHLFNIQATKTWGKVKSGVPLVREMLDTCRVIHGEENITKTEALEFLELMCRINKCRPTEEEMSELESLCVAAGRLAQNMSIIADIREVATTMHECVAAAFSDAEPIIRSKLAAC